MSDSGEFFQLQSRWRHHFPKNKILYKEGRVLSDADPNIAQVALGPGSAFSSCHMTLQEQPSPCK